MTHTPHELAEEFPDQVQLIADLKTVNTHFARLVDEYHEVNRAVHRAETNVEPTDDLNEEALRKKRMHLKDEIWQIMKST
jgi:uncharacterized protein YdcH (DUF465 family)